MMEMLKMSYIFPKRHTSNEEDILKPFKKETQEDVAYAYHLKQKFFSHFCI